MHLNSKWFFIMRFGMAGNAILLSRLRYRCVECLLCTRLFQKLFTGCDEWVAHWALAYHHKMLTKPVEFINNPYLSVRELFFFLYRCECDDEEKRLIYRNNSGVGTVLSLRVNYFVFYWIARCFQVFFFRGFSGL